MFTVENFVYLVCCLFNLFGLWKLLKETSLIRNGLVEEKWISQPTVRIFAFINITLCLSMKTDVSLPETFMAVVAVGTYWKYLTVYARNCLMGRIAIYTLTSGIISISVSSYFRNQMMFSILSIVYNGGGFILSILNTVKVSQKETIGVILQGLIPILGKLMWLLYYFLTEDENENLVKKSMLGFGAVFGLLELVVRFLHRFEYVEAFLRPLQLFLRRY